MTIELPDDMARAVLGAVRGTQMASVVFADQYGREAVQSRDPESAQLAVDLVQNHTQRAEVLAEVAAMLEIAMGARDMLKAVGSDAA